MAYLYRFLVSKPVIWDTNPGVGDDSMSTETCCPGKVIDFGALLFLGFLCRHGRQVARPYKHAAHAGIGAYCKCDGIIPCFAICCSRANGMCPYL